MKKNIEKIIIGLVIIIGIISIFLLITKKEETQIIIGNLKQTIVKESNTYMSISGKVITKNIEGRHIATVKLYKVISRDNEQLIITKDTNSDGTYEFDIEDAGNYKVIAEKKGYLSSEMHAIEVRRGDSLVLVDIELMPGDANGDGQIELDDLVFVNDNFGDIVNNEVVASAKGSDFNGDGLVNQDDKTFVKESYAKLVNDKLAAVSSSENNLITITMEQSDIQFPRPDSNFRYKIITNKEVELVDSSKVYLIQTGLTPEEINEINQNEGEQEETERAYILKSGERFINSYVYIEGLGTEWLANLSFYEECKNVKVVFEEGTFKYNDQISDETIVDLRMSFDSVSPEVELSGESSVTTEDDKTEINIPLKVTDKISGIKSFTQDNINILIDDIVIKNVEKNLSLISSEQGINNYNLKISGLNGKGTVKLKTVNNSIMDNAGNITGETILDPNITLEEVLSPIVIQKDFVASVETKGQPETATKYATLTEAISECEEGETIKLLTNFNESVTIQSDKIIELDLNGNSVGCKDTTTIVNLGNLKVIDTVGNGLVQQRSGFSDRYAIDNRGVLSINADISSDRVTIGNTGTMTLESGNILVDSYYSQSYCIYSLSGVVNINGGLVKTNNLGDPINMCNLTGVYIRSGILNMTAGEINIHGQDSFGIYAYDQTKKEINIKGGKILVNDDMPTASYYTNNYIIYVSGQSSKEAEKTIVNIGEDDGIVNLENPYFNCNKYIMQRRTTFLNIYDGLFVGGPQWPDKTAENYAFQVFPSNEHTKSYLIPKGKEAYIMDGENKIYYTTLQDAIDSVPNNLIKAVTIYVTSDVMTNCSYESEESETGEHTCGLIVPEGKNIIIDSESRDINTVHKGIINNGKLKIIGANIRSQEDNLTDLIMNNGELELIDVDLCKNITNNGNMIISGSSYMSIYSSENQRDAIINNGYLQITGTTQIQPQVCNGIINNEGATLILGDNSGDINCANPSVYTQSGNSIVNNGTFEMYNGTICSGYEFEPIQGEINVIRKDFEYEVQESCGTLKLKDAVAYCTNSNGKIYYFTLQEAVNDMVNNTEISSVYLLKDVEENIRIKYNPLISRKRLSINLNGYTIQGTRTTIMNTANNEIYLNGPGKIISTNECALQSESYIGISNVEIQGKTYGIINNNSMNISGMKVSGNIAIQNNSNITYYGENPDDGDEQEEINIPQIIGIEKGIENNGHISLYSHSKITGKVGIINSENSYVEIYDGNIEIQGEEIGIKNNGTVRTSEAKIVGKTAVQGNAITPRDSYRIRTSTENENEIIESIEAVSPQVNFYASTEDRYNQEFEIMVNIYDYGSGVAQESFTIDDIQVILGTTGLEPTVKKLEFVRKEGYSYQYKLVLAYDITDEALSGQSLTFKVPAESFYDNNNNMNEEYIWDSNIRVKICSVAIGDVKYGTIEIAAQEIPDGVETEITLLEDITTTNIIPENKVITLNTNGHLMDTGAGSISYVLEVNGTLNIRQKTNIQGRIKANSAGAINGYDGYVESINNYGTTNLYGGNYTSVSSLGTHGIMNNMGMTLNYVSVSSGGEYIQNSGTTKKLYGYEGGIATINGGIIGDKDLKDRAIENNKTGKIHVDNTTIYGQVFSTVVYTSGISTDPGIIITNSTIESAGIGIYAYQGTIKVSDSTISSVDCGVKSSTANAYVMLENVDILSDSYLLNIQSGTVDVKNSNLESRLQGTNDTKYGLYMESAAKLNIGTQDGIYEENNTIIKNITYNKIISGAKINMYDGKIIGTSLTNIKDAIVTTETGYTKTLVTEDEIQTIKLIQ